MLSRSRRAILYTQTEQIVQRIGPDKFVGKFHKIGDISGLNGQTLIRFVQDQAKVLSFRLVQPLELGKFCAQSCAPHTVREDDHNLGFF